MYNKNYVFYKYLVLITKQHTTMKKQFYDRHCIFNMINNKKIKKNVLQISMYLNTIGYCILNLTLTM